MSFFTQATLSVFFLTGHFNLLLNQQSSQVLMFDSTNSNLCCFMLTPLFVVKYTINEFTEVAPTKLDRGYFDN